MSAKGRLLGIILCVFGILLISTALHSADVVMGMGGLFILLIGIGKTKNG